MTPQGLPQGPTTAMWIVPQCRFLFLSSVIYEYQRDVVASSEARLHRAGIAEESATKQ
jgi:hypothetical protein